MLGIEIPVKISDAVKIGKGGGGKGEYGIDLLHIEDDPDDVDTEWSVRF